MVHNFKTIIKGIENLLKRNYKIELDKIDLIAEVDKKLTFSENWNVIKKKFIQPKLSERLNL